MKNDKKSNQYAVKLLERHEDYLRVGGWGVVFGGIDLEGETFTHETNFMDDLAPIKLVLFDHAIGDVADPVGATYKVEKRDLGVWVEAQIDRHNEYIDAIEELIESGVLGWSSGSVPHLVQKSAGVIKRWPIVEFSLTPTPAEPRTLGVDRLKMLASLNPQYKEYLPDETDAEISADAGADVKADSNIQILNDFDEGDSIMSEIKQENPELSALNAQMAEFSKTLSGITELLSHEKAARDAGIVAPESDGTEDKHVKSFADFMTAVRLGNHDRIQKHYKAALSGQTGPTGGYLVPAEYAEAIELQISDLSVMRRANPLSVRMSGSEYNLPVLDVEDAPSAGDTAQAGGAIAYWTAEGGSITEAEPDFKNIRLIAHKLACYALASNEVREDANVDGILMRAMANAVASKENYAFLRGDGVGKPRGILESGAVKSVTRSAASAVALADLGGMAAGLTPASWERAVWFFNPAVLQKLVSIADDPLSWQASLREGMPSLLMGRPYFVTGALPALNTLGDILLVDPSFYAVGDSGGMQVAFSEHFKFQTDQSAWRVTRRVAGQPLVDGTITLENAATTVSPFVGLAAG